MERLSFLARLRLLATAEGGRRTPILSDYRPSWDLGNTWQGRPTVNDGKVFLQDVDELAPGAEGLVRIEPMEPELWGRIEAGAVIAMQEGSKVVGHATILQILHAARVT
jgi:hypothetical protein